MKTAPFLALLFTTALAATAAAADESAAPAGGGCKMMKKEAAPEPACCCCKKMMSKSEGETKPADMDALLEQLKTAKGDQVIDTLAAVLNKLKAERQSAPGQAPEAPAHQH